MLELLQYSSTLGAPESVYARLDIIRFSSSLQTRSTLKTHIIYFVVNKIYTKEAFYIKMNAVSMQL